MAVGAVVGNTVTAVVGTFIVANVIGFPEVEAGEMFAAGGLIITGEPLSSLSVGLLSGVPYGALGGGVAGFALTPSVSSCTGKP